MMCLSEIHCNRYSQGYFVCTDIRITWITRPYIKPFVLVLLATVLSVLWFTDSDFPFGILRLFLLRIYFFMLDLDLCLRRGKSSYIVYDYVYYTWRQWKCFCLLLIILLRKDWRYHKVHQKPQIESQAMQLPTENRHKDKQWSTEHYA